jgi:hypothetical protein
VTARIHAPAHLAVEPSGAHGQLALRTRVALEAGAVVADFSESERVPAPERHTVQLDEHTHARLVPEALRYVNHSCAPNACFDVERLALVTLRAVAPGEELTFFYPSTEWSMAEPFDCACGAPECLGRVSGASALPPDALAGRRLSPHVRRLGGLPPARRG